MDSLKFHPGLPCPIFLHPVDGLPAGQAACGRLLPFWTPHAIRLWNSFSRRIIKFCCQFLFFLWQFFSVTHWWCSEAYLWGSKVSSEVSLELAIPPLYAQWAVDPGWPNGRCWIGRMARMYYSIPRGPWVPMKYDPGSAIHLLRMHESVTVGSRLQSTKV
jgi:hypothetical protein